MRLKVEVQGLRELDWALGQLPKATGKNVLRRTLMEAGWPMADRYAGTVRRNFGDLAESTTVSTKLSRAQRSAHVKKSTVEMFVGPGPYVQAITEEFGTLDQQPQGAMRAAWDAEKRPALETITTALADEIEKARKRIARKAARALKAAQ
jgi:hypothetical protein